MTALAPHLSSFLQDRLPGERGASIHTCDAYAYAFQLLLTFAAKKLKASPSTLTLEQLDAGMILQFLDYLEKTRGNSIRTRNARLAAYKSFMRFIEYRVPGCVQQVNRILTIPTKRFEETLVGYLTRAEMQAVLDAPNPTSRMGIRDRALLYVAFAAGLRVSELVGLKLEEIDFAPELSIHVHGKGRRERILPLWKTTVATLRAWLAVRGDVACTEVFVNSRGSPLTRDGFEYLLRKHVAIAAKKVHSLRKKHVSPHVLRHTCAMQILQATNDIRKVALWLGHSSVQTSEIYVRADPSEKLESIEGVLPPALRRGRFRAPDKVLAMLRQRP